MGTLVLSGPPTQLDQAHKNLTPDPGYDYDAAYDDEYPPQQPYPHPGIRGLQVTVPHQLTQAQLCSTEGTDASTLLVACPTLPSGDTRRRDTAEVTVRTRRASWTTGLGKSNLSLSIHLKLFFSLSSSPSWNFKISGRFLPPGDWCVLAQ